MRLFLIRHADPDYPSDSITLQGHREAKALAVRMQSVGLDRIFCSPMGRARATMRYTADRLGLQPVIENWTAELGQWGVEIDGNASRMIWDLDGQFLRQLNPPPGQHDWHRHPPLDDERFKADYDDLCAASDEFMARLGFKRDGAVYRVTRPNEEKIALFAHGGFGLTWLSHLLQIPPPMMWSGFFLWPSSVTTILMDERKRGIACPRCVGLADLSHLYQAGLDPQPRGIIANRE